MTEDHVSPKGHFTVEEVREIRARYAEGGISQMKLAEVYDVTTTCIARLLRGLTYKGVK